MTALLRSGLRPLSAVPATGLVLLLLVLSFLFGQRCLSAPSDTDQIRTLVRRGVDAVNQGDAGEAYRLLDLDFRSICPPARFAEALQAERAAGGALRVEAVEQIEVRGPRASAMVTVSGPNGMVRGPREFVREGSRWYLYEDLSRCGMDGGRGARGA